MQTPLAPKGEGADQKAKHGAMTPGPYLNGSTHWWAWAIHVGLLDRWTTALLESDENTDFLRDPIRSYTMQKYTFRFSRVNLVQSTPGSSDAKITLHKL